VGELEEVEDDFVQRWENWGDHDGRKVRECPRSAARSRRYHGGEWRWEPGTTGSAALSRKDIGGEELKPAVVWSSQWKRLLQNSGTGLASGIPAVTGLELGCPNGKGAMPARTVPRGPAKRRSGKAELTRWSASERTLHNSYPQSACTCFRKWIEVRLLVDTW